MYNEIIMYYSKNNENKFIMENPTIQHNEENRNCGETMEVFLKICENNKIIDWSFNGETSIITTACASIFGESILGVNITDVFDFDYEYIKELIGMDVSSRRKNASIFGLLATRNAIHKYLNDGKEDTFLDLIKS